jgi:7-carboxy-7-deazaguanine synthase
MASYAYQLKFVLERPEDVAEVRTIVERTAAEPGRVILMPEGTDADVLRERGRWLIEIAKQEGFRFSPRLHIELWGNRRGV